MPVQHGPCGGATAVPPSQGTAGRDRPTHKDLAEATMVETPDAPTVPAGPFTDPALWYGPDLAGHDDWVLSLSAETREELRTALRTARARSATLLRMAVADFPLPTLAAELRRAARTLSEGRGFLLIKGIPADLLGEAEASTVLRGIGQYLGRPVPQTADGRTLCHIRDAGPNPDEPALPAYLTRAALPFHTAEADLLGLLCLRSARSGGRTLLAGAAAVHNAVLDTRPDLAGRLYRRHLFDGPSGDGAYLASPLVTRHGDRPSMRYDRVRLGNGARTACDGGPDGEQAADRELYDLIDTTAASPAVRLELDLQPGDLLLLDNHVVLHARSAYEDFDTPESRRHLLRMWLARDEDAAPTVRSAGPHSRPMPRTGVTPSDVIRPRSLCRARPGCDFTPLRTH
ncbi:TauD/TfdA family dioxygenase [Streptomyces sp. NPDC007856]|uniref:TauD/TfdA family dioxygenase n=1 Tax=Streptomyces sp. NPDC007856 TaxID=3364781 RepID=UPI0036B43B84